MWLGPPAWPLQAGRVPRPKGILALALSVSCSGDCSPSPELAWGHCTVMPYAHPHFRCPHIKSCWDLTQLERALCPLLRP